MRNVLQEGNYQDEMTRGGFISHLESFIKDLLSSPKNAKTDDYLRQHGLDNKAAIKLLIAPVYKSDETTRDKNGKEIKVVPSAVIRVERIVMGEDGKDKFTVTYKVPRFKFKEKMRNLYKYALENGVIDAVRPLDETDCGGCLQGGGNNFEAGEYNTKLSMPIIHRTFNESRDMMKQNKRKTLKITEKQLKYIKETTTTMNAGDYIYDAPAFGDAETLDHTDIMKKSFQGK